jgi:predicted HicB family RNase H-like nuclease
MSERVTTKHGRTLSTGDVDELARKAEQGFDLSTWLPRRGRPSLDASSGSHSPRVSVRVPEALHRRATARAAEEGRSVSDVVRDLLEGYASEGPVEPAASARRR